jgi:hypothetical protein
MPPVHRCPRYRVRIVLAAFALGLLGCTGYGDRYTVGIDPTFTPDQTEAVLDAVNDWESHVPELNLVLRLEYCSGIHDGLICIHPTDLRGIVSHGGSRGEIGVTDHVRGWNHVGHIDGGDCYLDIEGIVNQDLVTTWHLRTPRAAIHQMTAHEMGHAMGLVHDVRLWTIMNAWFDLESATVTEIDVQQWRSLR